MPFNGAGLFEPIAAPDYPAIPGQIIKARQYNNLYLDVAAGLSNALTRDGQSPPTANIPFGGKLLTGLGDGIAPGDAVNKSQLDSGIGTAVGTWADVLASTPDKALGTEFARRIIPSAYGYVIAQTVPDMSVLVETYWFVGSNGLVAFRTPTTVTIAAADVTNDRVDLVYADLATGVPDKVTGVPAAIPVVSALPPGKIPLAFVYVHANDTAITQVQIGDVRAIPVAPDVLVSDPSSIGWFTDGSPSNGTLAPATGEVVHTEFFILPANKTLTLRRLRWFTATETFDLVLVVKDVVAVTTLATWTPTTPGDVGDETHTDTFASTGADRQVAIEMRFDNLSGSPKNTTKAMTLFYSVSID